MKLEKSIWDEKEFESLGWHDCTIYSIAFDYTNYGLIFDTDYIFEWSTDLVQYRITTSKLVFNNIHSVVMSFNFSSTLRIIIDSIERLEKRKTPNFTYDEWKYQVITNVGKIEFFFNGVLNVN